MNVIARLEFELVYYDSAVQRFKHYTTRTSVFVGLFLFFYLHSVIRWNGKVRLTRSSFFFFFFFLICTRLGLSDPFVSQNPREFYAWQPLGRILVCAHTIWFYGQNSIFSTIPSGISFYLSQRIVPSLQLLLISFFAQSILLSCCILSIFTLT